MTQQQHNAGGGGRSCDGVATETPGVSAVLLASPIEAGWGVFPDWTG